ncbi:MAG TPA: tetratricopeptide repeat protein [Steroidobacteraceae bacterium]|nr:tetratricopeptide repeat protein [Steroidobacteraceae bacterium]
MRRIIPGLLALVWAAAAWAGSSSLEFGPPQSWVKPTPLPAAGTDTQAAVKILLFDYQVELTPQTTRYYFESATHIQTPEGLTAAGNIAIVWDPDTDVVTVHKVQILRGNKVIDVLGAGQTFTIARRETNLDLETLDDALTAILQPAGLQVGDTVDLAYTLERTDPILAGTLSAQVEIPPELSVSRLHVSAQWPADAPVAWRATEGLTGMQQTHGDGMKGVTLTMSDVQPIQQPKDAPPRFMIHRLIEFSGLKTWSEVARRLAPLYQHAAELRAGSLLQAQISSIRAATPDARKRAALALGLVEDQIRYLLLAMNNGGLVPATADETWSRRYGDCKAKTVLLLALLHGLGIEARPVAVNVLAGDGLDQHLPSIGVFDHVLVQATIDGQTYWLDGTRMGDTSLDQLHEPFYHWGLPLVSSASQLTQMLPPPLTEPSLEASFEVDATGGVAEPAPVHAQTELHGATGVLLRTGFGNMTPTQLDTALRELWSHAAANVKVLSVAANYDAQVGAEQLTMDGTVTMDFSDGLHMLTLLDLGSGVDLKREPGPHQDAPFAVPYPTFMRTTEVIKLPLNGAGFSIAGADVDRTIAGTEFRRHAGIDRGKLTATASMRSVMPEFPASEAAADQEALHKLAVSGVGLAAPGGHVPTAAEMAWGVPSSNSTADSYAESGYVLYQHGEYDAAMADYDAALARNSHNATALGNRGISYYWSGEEARARSDFDAALAVDPHAWIALNGRGLLALSGGDEAGAIAAFTAAVTSNPKDTGFALPLRAQAYWRSGRRQEALADYSEAIQQQPTATGLYWYRAVLLREEGRKSEALRQAQLVIAANPNEPRAYLTAGAIYLFCQERSQASAAFDRAVAVAPLASTYLMRANYRPWTDPSAKRADVESALKLEPKSPAALAMLGQVQMAAGQFAAAASSFTDAMRGTHGSADLLASRAIAYEKAGQTALAQADLAKARQEAKRPGELNNLCWTLATAGTYLDSALADCNAAVAESPQDDSFQDSLGFVLLRLNRYSAAIAAYDTALKLNPLEVHSLYGRGICELRTGKESRGHADIKAATVLAFTVADEFAHYGVQP